MVEGSPADPIARLQHHDGAPASDQLPGGAQAGQPRADTATSYRPRRAAARLRTLGAGQAGAGDPAAAAPEADSAANRRRLSRFSSGVDPSSDRRSESYAHDSLAASVELCAVALNV